MEQRDKSELVPNWFLERLLNWNPSLHATATIISNSSVETKTDSNIDIVKASQIGIDIDE